MVFLSNGEEIDNVMPRLLLPQSVAALHKSFCCVPVHRFKVPALERRSLSLADASSKHQGALFDSLSMIVRTFTHAKSRGQRRQFITVKKANKHFFQNVGAQLHIFTLFSPLRNKMML